MGVCQTSKVLLAQMQHTLVQHILQTLNKIRCTCVIAVFLLHYMYLHEQQG